MATSEETTAKEKEKMLDALEKTLGIVTQASEISGVPRSTHYHWMRVDSEYAAKAEAMDDMALDFAESKLHKNISKGKETSIIFYLKTKGKKRGYIERLQLEDLHPPQPLEVEIVTSRKNAPEETDTSDD